jgi:hypothetical protein
MTIGADHPDWQDYVNWRGPATGAEQSFPVSPTNSYLLNQYVTNWASLFIYVGTTSTQGVTVALRFYTDDTETINVGEFEWQLGNGQILQCQAPILGNYMVFVVEQNAGSAQDLNITAIPSTITVPNVVYNCVGNFIEQNNYSVAASTTVAFLFPFVAEGLLSYYIRDPNTSGKLTGQFELASPTNTNDGVVWTSAGDIVTSEGSFNAPNIGLILSITNTDTSAHAVQFYAAIDGR